jgi:D-alanine-D-alanine ligase
MLRAISRVIILAGGPSPEAAVSRSTAAGMAAAVAELGLSNEVWELEGDWIAKLTALPKTGTFVLLALHGAPGEDGTVQGVLELLGLPYQGSGVAASAVCMDKILTRIVIEKAGVPVANALYGPALTDENKLKTFLNTCGKVVVKPACAGSSVGVQVVDNVSGFKHASDEAAKYGPYPAQNPVLAEQCVGDTELTASVLGAQALPIIEIVPQGAKHNGLAYDFNSKYSVGGSAHIVPANLPEDITNTVQGWAVAAGCAVGATGAYRVDFRYDRLTHQAIALEVNTLPGMTPTSLLPDAAASSGLNYTALVRWMITDGLQQWTLKHTPKT